MSLPIEPCFTPKEGLFCAGMPTEAALAESQQKGVKTVINLATSKELSFDEEAVVKALGMQYFHFPIAGADDFTPDTCRAFKALLDKAEQPVLLHCGTSNRVGAMLAAVAYHCEGAELEAALSLGRDSGLTRLEGPLRQCLCGE
ncbi:beta-lactamase hydrolase domain-containing protein [Gallaecimonas sp. GXIMD1310]|uniref:beta-lactamase hydrolase domain-containing protein n=1 Tax=Gallaecimonas sp. GXIMD1310 TaxID=3131926 RepID=UPI0032556EDD